LGRQRAARSQYLDPTGGSLFQESLLDESLEMEGGEQLTLDSVPEYIRDALMFLGVINHPVANDPD